MKNYLILFSLSILAGCGSVQIAEQNFIRPNQRSAYVQAEQFDEPKLKTILPKANLQVREVKSEDELSLHGIAITLPGAGATVMYFGGNMYRIDEDAKDVATALGRCPVNIVNFDYRGYGRNSGEPTIENMQADALRLYDQTRAQTTGPLILHGQSLGSFMAGYIASQRVVDGLILESTATNALDWANANIPWYIKPFVSITVSDKLAVIDNAKAVAAHKKPSLVIVGADDRITPPELASKVYAAIPSLNKKMLIGPAGGHNGQLAQTQVMLGYCAFVDSIKANEVAKAEIK
jgi:pimeloyl-ACP methyl ester carboxylesterase